LLCQHLFFLYVDCFIYNINIYIGASKLFCSVACILWTKYSIKYWLVLFIHSNCIFIHSNCIFIHSNCALYYFMHCRCYGLCTQAINFYYPVSFILDIPESTLIRHLRLYKWPTYCIVFWTWGWSFTTEKPTWLCYLLFCCCQVILLTVLPPSLLISVRLLSD